MRRIKEIAIIIILLFVGTYVVWATVSSQTTKVSFTCNGSTTTFSATGGNKIPCFAATDIKVYIRTDSTGAKELLTLTSDYSVTAFNNDFTNGFTVTTVSTYAAGKTLVIKRSIALTQEVNLTRGRTIPRKPMEKTLDRQMLALQDSKEELGRSLRIPVTDSSYDMNLPSSVDRANKYMAFGASGDPIVTSGTADSVVHSTFMETVADDADAAAVLTTLGLSTYIQTLIDDATAGDALTTLGFSSYIQTLIDDADSAEARTTLGVIPANNTYLVGVDAAGTGTVDLIKADANDVAVVPDNSQTATNAAPTSTTGIANKKYVDDEITSAIGTAGQYRYSGTALNGGSAINIPTAGTYVSVATGLSNRALCYIKVQNVSGSAAQITIRDKDESSDWDHDKTSEPGGVSKYYCDNNSYGAIVVPCNASGDIEITANGSNKDWKLWLMGYVE